MWLWWLWKQNAPFLWEVFVFRLKLLLLNVSSQLSNFDFRDALIDGCYSFAHCSNFIDIFIIILISLSDFIEFSNFFD